MKRTQSLILAICASAMVLGGCRSTSKKKKKSSSSGISQSVTVDPSKPVASIAITKAPDKTSYYAQEKFDPTGMVVIGTFEDGTSGDVTEYCTFAPERVSGSTTAVVVSFGGKTTSQPVTVTDWKSSDKELFRTYLRGFDDVPYMPVQGASLSRDLEVLAVSYSGGTSTPELLEKYSTFFDSSWNIEKTEDELYGLSYDGEKTVEDEDGIEYSIYVSLYAWDEDEEWYSADGNGVFYMDVSDGAYHSWDEFKEQNQAALDYFYDESDDEGSPVEFPDTIQYTGELSYIEAEPEYGSDGTVSFYSVTIYGVSATDAAKYISSFRNSDKWESYKDVVNNFEGFYHTSRNLAVRYDYYDSSEALFFFYGPFFDISLSWPEAKVSSLISGTNSSTTVSVPALTASDSYFEYEPQSDSTSYIFVLDSESKKSFTYADIEAYAAKFSEDAWIKDKILDDPEKPEGDYFYVMSSKDHAIEVQILLIEEEGSASYIGVAISVRAPLVHSFPSSESVVSFFAASQIAIESAPVFEVASTSGGFDISSTEKAISVDVFEATDDELTAFRAGFTGLWALSTSQSDTANGKYVYMYGATMARATIIDNREAQGYHYITVKFDVAKLDWDDEEKDAFKEHLHGVVPPFFEAELSSQLSGDTFYFYFYVGSTETQELINAYHAFLADPAWVQQGEAASFVYSFEGEALEIRAYWAQSGYFLIYLKVLAWTEEESKAFAAALHEIVPPYLGDIDGGSTATHFEGYDTVPVEELAKYDDILTEAEGWTKHGTGADAYYTKPSEDGKGYAKVWFKDYNGQGYYWIIEYFLND